MKVKLLVLENIEQEIQKEVKNLLKDDEKTSYDKVLAEIEGRKDESEENQHLFIDVSKFLRTTDFFFKKEEVKGLFMSTNVTKFNDKIMVILIDGKEYDCIFEESIFEELKNYLEQ